MITPKKKICKGCQQSRYLWSHGYCFPCWKYKSPVSLKRSPLKKKHKVTGELALFRSIWDERPHVCEKCGERLYEFSHNNFHHILGKGKYPELRLVKSNVLLICFDCHYASHFGNSVVPLD